MLNLKQSFILIDVMNLKFIFQGPCMVSNQINDLKTCLNYNLTFGSLNCMKFVQKTNNHYLQRSLRTGYCGILHIPLLYKHIMYIICRSNQTQYMEENLISCVNHLPYYNPFLTANAAHIINLYNNLIGQFIIR